MLILALVDKNFTFSIWKIKELRRLIDEKNAKLFIEVDGGVNGLNASDLEAAGADILVAGSYIFLQMIIKLQFHL